MTTQLVYRYRSLLETLLQMVREEIIRPKARQGYQNGLFVTTCNSPMESVSSELIAEPLFSPMEANLYFSVLHQVLVLHNNLMRSGQRVSPRFEITAYKCLNLESLLQKVVSYYDNFNPDLATVCVLLSKGLTLVQNNAEWTQTPEIGGLH